MNDERFGIWGGLSERERRKLKKQRGLSRSASRAHSVDADLDRPGTREFGGATRSPLGSSTVSATVVALLVSHDGARWLPTVIDGIRAQRRPVDRVVAVDTTSRDDSPALLTEAFGEPCHGSRRHRLPRRGPARPRARPATRTGSGCSTTTPPPTPAPSRQLLAAAEADPTADILGPKLREWPSLRRLLELGITISGTGRRETGLERGEYDQGQHDEVRPVLAVNTAGMLVRRSVLEALGGFDEQMPIFGNDIDFGWRAAAAGHRTLIVPQAVVFHAEAAHRGVRRTPLTGRHIHYQERRAALYTLLVNASTRSLPWRVLRLGLGTLVRMVGLLLVRQVGQALDELAALVSLYGKPATGAAGAPRPAHPRRGDRVGGRRRQADARAGLGALPARPRLRQRPGRGRHQPGRRRRRAAPDRRPASRSRSLDEEDPWAEEQGWVARFFTNPVALGGVLFVLLALIGAREAFGTVAGGALSPAPESVTEWWRLHVESQHPLGQGTGVPAPAYVLPLALLGSVVSPTAAVSLLLVLAVPLSFWGAWRFLRVVGRLLDEQGPPAWLLFLGATTYALIPAASGAWGLGRLGVVVAATVLPWLAHAALGFADPEPDRRWRAAWRTGLLLALAAAFAPLAFWFSLVLAAARRRCRLLDQLARHARPLGLGTAGGGPGRAGAAARPVVGARAADRCRPRPWCSTSGGCRWPPSASRTSSPATSVTPAPRRSSGCCCSRSRCWRWSPPRTRIPVLVCWIVVFAAALVALALAYPTFETRRGLHQGRARLPGARHPGRRSWSRRWSRPRVRSRASPPAGGDAGWAC